MCIDRARKTGACVLVLKYKSLWYIGYYPMMAARQNVRVCAANTLSYCSAFWWKSRVIGSDPLSIAVPAGKYDDFVLDMATATVAWQD